MFRDPLRVCTEVCLLVEGPLRWGRGLRDTPGLWELEGSGGRAREAGAGGGGQGREAVQLPGGTETQVPRSGPCPLPCSPACGSCVILEQSPQRPRRAFLAPGLQCPTPHLARSDLQGGSAEWPFPPGFRRRHRRFPSPTALCWTPLVPLLVHGVTSSHLHTLAREPLRVGLWAGLRAPAYTHSLAGRRRRGPHGEVVGTALLVGGAGKPLPGLASGEGDAAGRPPPTLGSVPRLLSCVLRSGSAGRALLCALGARGQSSAADGSTALQEGRMAPGSFLLLGSDHNVTPKGLNLLKAFFGGWKYAIDFLSLSILS